MRVDTGFLVGCDLGQANDPTTVVVAQRWETREWYDRSGAVFDVDEAGRLGAERLQRYGCRSETLPSYDIVHAERVPLDTPYPEVEAILRQTMGRPELAVGRRRGTDGEIVGEHRRPPRLIVDATGVGRPVLDHLRVAGLDPVGILIHGGDTVTQAPFLFRVPKRDLVGVVSVRLQNRTLRFSADLPFAPILKRELLNFRVRIDPVTSHDSYAAWREGDHDDLVLATAVALWWGDRQLRGASDGAYGTIKARS
jgi:hypothetical protein